MCGISSVRSLRDVSFPEPFKFPRRDLRFSTFNRELLEFSLHLPETFLDLLPDRFIDAWEELRNGSAKDHLISERNKE